MSKRIAIHKGGEEETPRKKSTATIGPLKNTTRLGTAFFKQNCVELAKSLLGQNIVKLQGNNRLVCKIVETESYLVKNDKASHSHNHKQTKRNGAMFMDPGTVYVYMTYGMYYCMNFSSQAKGNAVLIRAAKPIEGIDLMKSNREKLRKSSAKTKLLEKHLCNGPSKLCQALTISKMENKLDLLTSEEMWLEKGDPVSSDNIVVTTRIGLNEKLGDSAKKLLRFYVLGDVNVSKRDKIAEALLTNP